MSQDTYEHLAQLFARGYRPTPLTRDLEDEIRQRERYLPTTGGTKHVALKAPGGYPMVMLLSRPGETRRVSWRPMPNPFGG